MWTKRQLTLRSAHIYPYDSPEVVELRTHLNAYVKRNVWSGSISFLRFGRIAKVNLRVALTNLLKLPCEFHVRVNNIQCV